MSTGPLLEMRGIGKRFPGVVALDGVSLEVGRGEVVALCGENGAGKSTLVKILGGVYQPDAGEILVDENTHRLLEGILPSMPTGEIQLKGFAAPVPAFRLEKVNG